MFNLTVGEGLGRIYPSSVLAFGLGGIFEELVAPPPEIRPEVRHEYTVFATPFAEYVLDDVIMLPLYINAQFIKKIKKPKLEVELEPVGIVVKVFLDKEGSS